MKGGMIPLEPTSYAVSSVNIGIPADCLNTRPHVYVVAKKPGPRGAAQTILAVMDLCQEDRKC